MERRSNRAIREQNSEIPGVRHNLHELDPKECNGSIPSRQFELQKEGPCYIFSSKS